VSITGSLPEMRVVDDNHDERATLAQLRQERGNFGDPAIADSGATPLGIGDRLVGERAGRFYFLAPGDVDYIQADSNYMYLRIGNDRYINRDSLKRVAPLLQPLGFIRISRSILLNLRRVAYAEREGRGILAFTLNSGVRLVSSAGYRIAAGANLQVDRRCGSRRFRELS
jgi:two-component system, LytTR family, response regulator